jgi:hypothetical protein
MSGELIVWSRVPAIRLLIPRVPTTVKLHNFVTSQSNLLFVITSHRNRHHMRLCKESIEWKCHNSIRATKAFGRVISLSAMAKPAGRASITLLNEKHLKSHDTIGICCLRRVPQRRSHESRLDLQNWQVLVLGCRGMSSTHDLVRNDVVFNSFGPCDKRSICPNCNITA